MWVAKYFVYFMIYSMMGWIYETIFCTIKGGKWENRGFLYGPVCPIYGAGAVALTAILNNLIFYKISFTWWQVFIVGFFGSIVLEFGTSWVLEKLFHAYWWDYSDMPLNIQGRVCFPYSCAFGFAALIVVYLIAPVTTEFILLFSPTGLEIFALILMGILAGDTTLTISALSNFSRNFVTMQDSINEHMDVFVDSVKDKTQSAGNIISEERERFSRESMEHAISAMGAVARDGIKRVQGFKLPQRDKSGQKSLDKFFEAVKKRIPKRERKMEMNDN